MTARTATSIDDAVPPSPFERWEGLRAAPVWTPEIRRAAARARYVIFRFRPVIGAPAYLWAAKFVTIEFTQTRRTAASYVEVECAGFISAGRRDRLREVPRAGSFPAYRVYDEDPENIYAPDDGTWFLGLAGSHVRTCLRSIPAGSRVVPRVSLDYHTSPVLADAGLHSDALTVDFFRGKREGSFELDAFTGRHNSARFGFVPGQHS